MARSNSRRLRKFVFRAEILADQLVRKRKVEVGQGYATPLLLGDRVYCFVRRGANEVMIALEVEAGKIAWQTAYPAPYKMADPTRAHGEGPKSTPLFFDGKIYALGISGVFSAFDARNGHILWQRPAPAEQPFFGTASSPLGEKDMVIVHPGNYGPLTAFDANTGDVKWTAVGDGLYASPVIVELAGVRQVVSMGQQNIAGFAVSDGALLWQYAWPGQDGGMQAITPIYYRDTILISSYHAGVTALKPTHHDGFRRRDLAHFRRLDVHEQSGRGWRCLVRVIRTSWWPVFRARCQKRECPLVGETAASHEYSRRQGW